MAFLCFRRPNITVSGLVHNEFYLTLKYPKHKKGDKKNETLARGWL
jgi:hypothetical protein